MLFIDGRSRETNNVCSRAPRICFYTWTDVVVYDDIVLILSCRNSTYQSHLNKQRNQLFVLPLSQFALSLG